MSTFYSGSWLPCFFDIFALLAQYSRYMRHKDNALLRPVDVSECISVVIASCKHILDEQK